MTDPPSWLANLSLRRIITSNRFIPEVDGFRFVAIFAVILPHLYGTFQPMPTGSALTRFLAGTFSDGRRGVFLFFTISGFILALPFARHHLQQGNRVHLRSYFRRRLTRLEPPFILAMLVRAPIVAILKKASAAYIGIHLLASLLYVHNIVYAGASIINPPAWSLEVEVQFYLLAPLLTGLFLIRGKWLRRTVLLALIVVSGVCAQLFVDPNPHIALTLLGYFHYFMAGFLLCDLYLCGDKLPLPPWLWDGLGVASLVWIVYSHAYWYSVILPFATLVLYMAGFHGRACKAFFSFSPISLIGGMCYSLYLTHTTALVAMTPWAHLVERSSLGVPVQLLLIVVPSCLGVLAVGTGYFLLIERPCMDPAWPNKLAMRWRQLTHDRAG